MSAEIDTAFLLLPLSVESGVWEGSHTAKSSSFSVLKGVKVEAPESSSLTF